MCVSRRFTAEVEGAVLRKRVADTQRKAARRRMVTQASHRERSLSDIFVAERPEMIPPTPPQAGVPERQMAGPNPQKGPTNTLELL